MAKTPKVNTSLRIAQSGLDQAGKLAAQHHVDRADVLRAAMAVGFRHTEELDKLIMANRAS